MRKSFTLYKKVFTILSILSIPVSFYGETPLRTADLATLQPSWQAVIGGTAVAPVAETSYGFAVVSDGRLVSTCTSRGNVMWQKGVKGRPSPYFSAWGDFIYSVTNKTVLNFVNPSGVTVWSQDTGFEIKCNPVTGWDGRVFVQGNNQISCYSLKGSRKWNIKIPQINSLPLCEFSDGSFLVFLSKTVDNKTTALRISPFGELLEEITFAGQILCAAGCPQGVLMSFTDGSFGLCSIKNNSAFSSWVVHENRASQGIKAIISDDEYSALLFNYGSELNILIIKNSDGSLKMDFTAGTLNTNQLKFYRNTAQGYFAADTSKAIEFDIEGTILWEAKLPDSSKWNYIHYTNSNQILLCMNDWVLNAFVMNQSVTKKPSYQKSIVKNYTTPSSISQKYDGVTYNTSPLSRLEEIRNTFRSGDYGTSEKQMLSELQEHAASYTEELTSKAKNTRPANVFYSKNPVYTQTLLEAIAATGTDTFILDLSEILKLESDPLILNCLIKTAGDCGYDRDGLLLKSFEYITANKVSRKDVKTAQLICDSIYSIVAFMGRPALYRQGKAILSNFMYPQYDKEIRDYATQTLRKIITLEI